MCIRDSATTAAVRADRHLRAVPHHRGGSQPDREEGARGRDPTARGGAGHGDAARRRVGQGVRGAHHGGGDPPRDPGGFMTVFAYRAADRRGQTIDGVMAVSYTHLTLPTSDLV